MKIAATSDLHGLSKLTVPELYKNMCIPDDVDVIVIAGDIFPTIEKGPRGQVGDLCDAFIPWVKSIGIPVVLTLGNHDYITPDAINKILGRAGILNQVSVLINESVTLHGVKFYGSPWSPTFCDWNYNASELEIEEYISNMDYDVDVFITHTPPHGTCDAVSDTDCRNCGDHLGSLSVMNAILKKSPRHVICGHIHTGSHSPTLLGDSLVTNVSLRNEQYTPVYTPYCFEVDNG